MTASSTSGSDNIANPPSHLSLFGIDFTMKALWIVTPAEFTADEEITLKHTLHYSTGSHTVENTTLTVTLDAAPEEYKYTSDNVDLTLLDLDPIVEANANNGAVVGFLANKFLVAPAPTATFLIVSGDNNIRVTGTGLDAPTPGSAMVSALPKGSATILLDFKILDVDNSYTLYFKHWKTVDNGCVLTINNDTDNQIVKHVAALEAEGGDNNFMGINLRNRDYSSIDYHDYLTLGLNTVEIDIALESTSEACGYAIRALAIGSYTNRP